MKSLWATWSKQSRPENRWDLGHYTWTWSPVPPYPANVAEEINSHSVAWAKRPDTPFIRPAIREEIEQRNEIIRRIQSAEVYAKWGLESEGAPLDSRWDLEHTLQARRCAYLEIKTRLEQLDLFKGSAFDDEEMSDSLFGRDNEESSSDENIQAIPPPLPEGGQTQDAGMAEKQRIETITDTVMDRLWDKLWWFLILACLIGSISHPSLVGGLIGLGVGVVATIGAVIALWKQRWGVLITISLIGTLLILVLKAFEL